MSKEMEVLEITPLLETLDLGEEAEVYGYNECTTDCLTWSGSTSGATGCQPVYSCTYTCWW